jgi:tripartite-type tricarboxylate transporter receptor subunit TctC
MKAFGLFMCALIAGSMIAFSAQAQSWPARPVRLLLPYAPGGGVDIVARTVAQKLAEQTGGSFIVENRPGGTGIVATELVARAAPDGYTLLVSATEFGINPAVRAKLPYDPFKDFTYISQLASVQFLLVSHPSVPLRSVRQIIELAKLQPGRLTYGSSGTAGGPHLAGELFQVVSGARWTHVPFKGAGPAMIGVMSGEVDFSFGSTISYMEPARSGKVRAIAVTGAKRFPPLPAVPTVAESGAPGYIATGWYGFYGPAGLPPELVRRLHSETARAFDNPDVKERLERAGNELVMSSPEEFTAFMRAEIAKWSRVVKASNMQFD